MQAARTALDLADADNDLKKIQDHEQETQGNVTLEKRASGMDRLIDGMPVHLDTHQHQHVDDKRTEHEWDVGVLVASKVQAGGEQQAYAQADIVERVYIRMPP